MLTLVDAAISRGADEVEAGVIAMFEQSGSLPDDLTWKKITGDSIRYRREVSLPAVQWRAVNGTYAESTGVINPEVESLMIVGGEVMADNFILATTGDSGRDDDLDQKALQFGMKAQALAIELDRAYLEGDEIVDPNCIAGLRRRLTGNQVILQAAGGGALTLAFLDQLIDLVPFGNKKIYLNRFLRRKITDLENSVTGIRRIEITRDEFGRQIETYNGIQLRIVEQSGDASTHLAFDEDPGDAVADTASIYVVSHGLTAVHAIWNGPNGMPVQVRDFGEQQAAPRHMGRIEFYPGLVIKHGRAAARGRGILAA